MTAPPLPLPPPLAERRPALPARALGRLLPAWAPAAPEAAGRAEPAQPADGATPAHGGVTLTFEELDVLCLLAGVELPAHVAVTPARAASPRVRLSRAFGSRVLLARGIARGEDVVEHLSPIVTTALRLLAGAAPRIDALIEQHGRVTGFTAGTGIVVPPPAVPRQALASSVTRPFRTGGLPRVLGALLQLVSPGLAHLRWFPPAELPDNLVRMLPEHPAGRFGVRLPLPGSGGDLVAAGRPPALGPGGEPRRAARALREAGLTETEASDAVALLCSGIGSGHIEVVDGSRRAACAWVDSTDGRRVLHARRDTAGRGWAELRPTDTAGLRAELAELLGRAGVRWIAEPPPGAAG